MIRGLPQSLVEASTTILENTLYESIVLTEDRISFLKDRNQEISTAHDPMAKHKEAGDIIDHLASSGDPSKKKLYTQWLVGQYKKGNLKQEDAYKYHDVLADFDKYKGKLQKKDINQYGHINDVAEAVKPHIGTGATKAEERQLQKQELDIPGHKKVYDDENISMFHLTDKGVSQKLYGKSNDPKPGVFPTQWCTATQSDEHNMFDHYHNDDPRIHVIHRKSDGAVFQYHANSNQFMDKDDNEISAEDFKSIAPSLHKAWRANPELV